MASRARSTTRSGTTIWSTCSRDGTCLIYIDRHLVHEVTSPQAFEGPAHGGRKVRAPEQDAGRRRPQCADHRPLAGHSTIRKAACRSSSWRTTPRNSASNISTNAISARASCTSSAPNRASPCRARPSSAATATPRRMAPSARWRLASARPKSSMCWRRRR